MNVKYLASSIVICTLASVSATTFAADEAELDVIMSVVGEEETPDQVIQRIELPTPMQRQTLPDTRVRAEETQAVKNAVRELLLDRDSALSDEIKEAIASGDIDSLPDIIRDNLPEDLLDDLTGDIDDLVGDLDDLIDIDDVTGNTDHITDDLPLNLR